MPMLNRATVVDPSHGELYFWARTDAEVRRFAEAYIAKNTASLEGARPHLKEVRKVAVPTKLDNLVNWLNSYARRGTP